MEIKEIKEITINEKSICLSEQHLVDVYGLSTSNLKILLKEEKIILYFDFDSSSSYQICQEEDLNNLLSFLDIQNIDIEVFRLKIIDTKKWGKKPIYFEGADSICFSCICLKEGNRNFIVFYNSSGTKAIEYVYIHGIWEKI